ncbi:hypothetical protein [Methyloceanibacter superfactus]|uniref:hypothetical protein n=1 Tax=Methyloceanibacter superfactus TaxID=1774969 RepID=UPI000AE1F5B1|nr:hypothetical protein [Methyloceanibacter superfactus]
MTESSSRVEADWARQVRGIARLLSCRLVFSIGLAIFAVVTAEAADLNSIPEVIDFQGRHDPPTAPNVWERDIDRSLDDLVETVKNRRDLTTDVAIPGESVREHATGATGDPLFGTQMGEILRGDTLPEDVRDTNPYARLTAKTEDRLRDSMLAAPKGSLTPARVMDMALDASGGNYPIATLTAHSVLKSHTKRGREIIEKMQTRVAALSRGTISQAEYDRQMADLRKQLRPHSEIASRLQNLRADPTATGDKLGPWYHTFGVMALGSVHGGTDATGGVLWEHASKWLGWFGGTPFNPEKASIDAKVAVRTLDPRQLGGYERDRSIAGPHPSEFIPDYFDDPIVKEEARLARCTTAGIQADRAIAELQGPVSAAKIDAAKTKLPTMKGQIAECPEMAGKVATIEQAAAAAADSIIRQGQEALSSCDPQVLSHAASEVAALSSDPRAAQIKNQLERNAPIVKEANGAFEAGNQSYLAGDLGAARASLLRARDAIGGLGGTACPELRERIAKGLDKIDTLTSALDKITAAIDSCDARGMENYRRQLAGVQNPHPIIQEKMAELDRVAARSAKATAAFDEANVAFKAGELSEARAKLQSAEDEVRALNGNPPCPGLLDRIAAGRGKITRIEDVLTQADAAIGSCDVEQLDALQSKLGAASGTHKSFRYKATELEQAKAKCGQQAIEAATSDCVNKYGSGYSAGSVSPTGATIAFQIRRQRMLGARTTMEAVGMPARSTATAHSAAIWASRLATPVVSRNTEAVGMPAI